MQILSAKDAKYGFARLIDLARVGPVAVAKHGRLLRFARLTPRIEQPGLLGSF